MTAISDKKMRFSAIDNISGPIDKISSKFPKMTRNVKKSFKSFERLQKSSQKLRASLSKVGGGMKTLGTGMTASLTLPIVAFAATGVRAAIGFERSMNKVEAKTGATGKELLKLTNLAKKMGQTTKFKASEAAEAMAFLGQAGFDTNQILAATPGVLNLAAASNTDLARSADIASNIMGAFGLKAKDMNNIADILAATTASANVDLEQLAETMKQTAPIAKMYGLSLEETAAVTGLLGNVGIQGSTAGTALKNMMLKLAAPTSMARKLMKRLNVEVVDSSGNMLKINKVLGNLGPALKKLPKSKQLAVLNEVFGKRAIAGAGELLSQSLKIGKDGKNAIERYTDSLEKASDGMGVAAKQAKILQKGLPGALDRMMSAFESFQLSVFGPGTALNEFFESVLNGMASMFVWLANLNPSILKWGAIIAGVVAILGPLVFIFGSFITMLPFIITGFEALAVLFPILQIGLLPVLLIVAKFVLIAALFAGAAYMIYNAWGDFSAFFSELFSEPLQTIKDMFFWAAKLTGLGGTILSAIFGSETSDDVDAKLRKQGFKIGGAGASPSGEDTGSRDLTQKNFEYVTRKQQASVDVKFSNLPRETFVMTDDRESILNVDTGMMGAM